MKKAIFLSMIIGIALLLIAHCGNWINPLTVPQQGLYGIQVMKGQAQSLTHQVVGVNAVYSTSTSGQSIGTVWMTFSFDVDEKSIGFTTPIVQGSLELRYAGNIFSQVGKISGQNTYVTQNNSKQIQFQIVCPAQGATLDIIAYGGENGTSNKPCVLSTPLSGNSVGFCLDQDGYYNANATIGVNYNGSITCP